MYGRQVSKNVLASGVQKLSGASGVQKFPGVRCPKLFGSQVSRRQVSKSCPGRQVSKMGWALGVQNVTRASGVHASHVMGVRCPKSLGL